MPRNNNSHIAGGGNGVRSYFVFFVSIIVIVMSGIHIYDAGQVLSVNIPTLGWDIKGIMEKKQLWDDFDDDNIVADNNNNNNNEETFNNITSTILVQPYQCPQPTPNSNQYNTSQIDWSDPIFERWGWDNDPIIIESYKFMFFTIPKNSCTEWKSLFRRMMNYSDWNTKSPHDPQYNNLRYLGQYPKQKQYEFMTSPDWTRAIFVREPMERLLSGYMDKGLSGERYVMKFCCQHQKRSIRNINNQIFQDQCRILTQLGLDGPTPTVQEFPFSNFVHGFMVQCTDAHWAKQSSRLRPNNWQFINFVGHFHTLAQDAKCLLERLHVWDEFGASGWGKYGNLSIFERNTAHHATSSRDRKQEFYTPDVLPAVYQYLHNDYEFDKFHFTKPPGME